MTVPRLDRRDFLRLAGLGSLGLVAAACSGDTPGVRASTSPTPSGTGTSPSPSASPSARALAWSPLAATGPSPRRDHTLTANDGGTIAYLFGGRAKGTPLGDLWAFDRAGNAWHKLEASGAPAPRFGHSAAFIDGHLVIFGGQGTGTTFFNDARAFDPVHGTWTLLRPAGGPPAARYGAGGTRIGTALTITHGFTNTGRFDDTWALASRWTDVSPTSGNRPIKRCLHRTAYIAELGRMLMFGGQTDGRPHLGDTWLYNPTDQAWSGHGGRSPAARNLYALAATAKTAYLFGGAGGAGPTNDVWSFDNQGWKQLKPSGSAPAPRSGIEGAIVAGPSMLVFGGAAGSGELADLWELSVPA